MEGMEKGGGVAEEKGERGRGLLFTLVYRVLVVLECIQNSG